MSNNNYDGLKPWRSIAGLVVAGFIPFAAGCTAQTQQAQAQTADVDVLARGPVHEAYAKPTTESPAPGPVIDKKPPDPIEELPPDQKPEGDNVQWIPGYWSWDADGKDYIWVSGFWRAVPAGRHWVPGHWQEVANGWVWVSGFWAPENLTNITYLPAPPPAEDVGPSVPAPDATSTYVPGIWVYRENRYYWRPGFWTPYRVGWVWIPASYIWTPTGYLFVEGYWDLPLGERGLLFAPVRFGPLFFAARRPYAPEFVVRADFLFGSLFVGPGVGSYYFGDYFEPGYASVGYIPWVDFRIGRTAYDANYSYFRQRYATDPQWEAGLRDLYRSRTSGQVARPPRTLTQQSQILTTLSADRSGSAAVSANINLTRSESVTAITPLKDVHNTKVTGLAALGQATVPAAAQPVVKLGTVSKEDRDRTVQAAARLRAIAEARKESEDKMLLQGNIPHVHTDPPKAVKVPWQPPAPPAPAAKPPVTTGQPMVAPPAPAAPAHVEKPVPNFTPPKPPAPPAPKKKDKDKGQ